MRIHRSNFTERLVDRLADRLAEPAPPLLPDVVLVHSNGLGVWLEQSLADRLGLCANVHFLQPLAFVEHLLQANPHRKNWSQQTLVWALYDHLHHRLPEPAFQPVREWSLEDGVAHQDRRLADLALDLAPRFERYALYRPDASWVEPGDWQSVLWADLCQQRPSLGQEVKGLTPGSVGRVAAFCPGTLPPLVVRLLQTLDADLYLLRPKSLDRHPLMASLGGQAAAFSRVIEDVLPDVPRLDHFEARHAPGLLGALQADLAEGTCTPTQAEGAVRVHACGGAWRQVEVLRDVLLEALEDDTLEPRHMLVMTTDIERFGPMISAALSLDRGPNSPAIPHRLADTSLRSRNTAAAALLEALDLVQGRFEVTRVLDLLARPEVAANWELDARNLEQCRTLAAEASIHWGRDADHRKALDLPEVEDFTWRRGTDRLLLALASEHGWQGVVPAGQGRERLIEPLVRFVEGLVEFHDQFTGELEPEAWEALMLLLLEHLCGEVGWTVRAVREVLREVAESAKGCDRRLPLPAFQRMLEGRFSLSEPGSGYLAGGVTVCAMVPMRSIPFRVVCLMGMDEDAFPRPGRQPRYDKMASTVLDGDVEARRDDRALLLETLLSTRQQLEIFTTSRAPRDGTKRPPAVPVSELMDVLERMSPGARKRVLVEHPLQPHDPRVYAQQLSFDPLQHQAALAELAARGAPAPTHRFLDTALDAPKPGSIELFRLVQCIKNPMKAFCTRTLGLYLQDYDEHPSDDEPLEGPDQKDHLARWKLKETITQALLDGDDPLTVLQTGGKVPAGTPGQILVNGLLPDCSVLAEEVRPLLDGAQEIRRIELEVDGWRVWGNVTLNGGRLVRWTPSSAKSRHKLETWILHLALSAAGTPPDATFLVNRGRAWTPPALSPNEASTRLQELVGVYVDAQRAPLPFDPDYTEAVRRNAKTAKWSGGTAYHRWVLGSQPPDRLPLEGVPILPGRSFAELGDIILGNLP